MVVKEIEVRDIMSFTNHPEPWGGFADIKSRPEINKPGNDKEA